LGLVVVDTAFAAATSKAAPVVSQRTAETPNTASPGSTGISVAVEPAAPTAPPNPTTLVASADEEEPLDSILAEDLDRLAEYRRAVLSWVEDDGYPMNVDVEIEVKLDEGIVRFSEPVGFHIQPGTTVAITGSYVRPLPLGGFTQRRYVTIWGSAAARPRGRFAVAPVRSWSRDEGDRPMVVEYERSLPKARRYYADLEEQRGEPVRPGLSQSMLFLHAARESFLGAAIVPVLVGLAVAARANALEPVTAALTLAAAVALHLGMNVASGAFHARRGAAADTGLSSGGARVLRNALVGVGEMTSVAAWCYATVIVLGIALLVLRGSPALAAIGLFGLALSLAYGASPIKLAYRGLGEVATAIGFGPLLLVGTYVVQSRGYIPAEAVVASIPFGLLLAAVVYVGEIPDRAADRKAGKKTLPVRWSKSTVTRFFDGTVATAFLVVALGVLAGLLPLPALVILAAAPFGRGIHANLVRFYDSGYALATTVEATVRLYFATGLLLLAAYAVAIAAQTAMGLRLYLW
jgi:1,4-dihydroxy-2-naphthoate octaprenyltransferase